jgi:hypothetical protein
MLTDEKIRAGLSPEWTAADRLLALAALLPGMQSDIYAGRYSAPGRPNITSLQHLFFESAEVLEAQGVRQELAQLVAEMAADLGH